MYINAKETTTITHDAYSKYIQYTLNIQTVLYKCTYTYKQFFFIKTRKHHNYTLVTPKTLI